MKVRRGKGYVPQGWRLEDVLIALGAGYLEAPGIPRGNLGLGLLHHPKGKISRSPHIDSTVTADAPLIHEDLQAGKLFSIQRRALALEIPVKRRVRGQQGSLKCIYGLCNVIIGYRVASMGEGLFKQSAIFRHALYRLHHQLRRAVHFNCGLGGSFGLFF